MFSSKLPKNVGNESGLLVFSPGTAVILKLRLRAVAEKDHKIEARPSLDDRLNNFEGEDVLKLHMFEPLSSSSQGSVTIVL